LFKSFETSCNNLNPPKLPTNLLPNFVPFDSGKTDDIFLLLNFSNRLYAFTACLYFGNNTEPNLEGTP